MKQTILLALILCAYFAMNIATKKEKIECEDYLPSESDIRTFLTSNSDKFTRIQLYSDSLIILTYKDSAGINSMYLSDSICKHIYKYCRSNYVVLFKDTTNDRSLWNSEYGRVFFRKPCQ